MNIETKLVINLNNPNCSTQDLRLELKMSEAEELYNKLKEIFDKPKKELNNPHNVFFRDGDAPLPKGPFYNDYVSIPCSTGTPLKFDDMTITCRVEGSGASNA